VYVNPFSSDTKRWRKQHYDKRASTTWQAVDDAVGQCLVSRWLWVSLSVGGRPELVDSVWCKDRCCWWRQASAFNHVLLTGTGPTTAATTTN